MDKELNFDNFGAVWDRITQAEEEAPVITSVENPPAEKICIKKCGDKSRAVRFIPEV